MSTSDIRFYIWLLRRRLPYIVAAMFLSSAVGLCLALSLVPKYRATATILLESPAIPTELARTTISYTSIEQMQVIEQEIKARDQLLALAGRLKIYSADSEPMTGADIVNDLRARISFQLLPAAQGTGGVAFFGISFEAEQSELSASVANEVVALIVNKNARSRAGRASATMQFFEDETVRLDAELKQVEDKILAFKNANYEALPDSLNFRMGQQTRAQERLQALDREESDLRGRRISVTRMNQLGINTGGAAITPEGQALADLNKALTAQLALFSETSPGIVLLRTQITALKERMGPSPKLPERDTSLLAGQSQLSEIEDRLASIDRERTSTKAELDAITASIEATPASENALTALTRNRDNIQLQYNAAIGKLAEASVGERIEVDAKGGRISVVEAAIAPERPFGTKRRLIVLASLALGGMLSLAIIMLLEMMNSALRRPLDVERVLRVRPLATIPFMDKRLRQPRRGLPILLKEAVAASIMLMLLALSGTGAASVGPMERVIVTNHVHGRQ
jgi:succinoglycan biosynthesis transport protein ExoP